MWQTRGVRSLSAVIFLTVEIGQGCHATRSVERDVASTVAREAYFLDYAKDIRAAFKGALMVTGGFRSRAGMDAALQANACDIVGVGRPLCVDSNVVNKLLSGA